MFFGVVLGSVIGLDDGGEAIAVPLLATQILWINLLTDGAPALALGIDPPPHDVMRRPPRRLTDRVIDAEMWVGIVWIGAVMALVTLLALDLGLPGGLVGGSGDVVHARTMAFTTLVLAQLFNCFNARSDRTSAFRRLFTNRLLWSAIALSAAASGRGRAAVLPQRGIRHHAARGPRLDDLHRAGERRPLGGGGEEARHAGCRGPRSSRLARARYDAAVRHSRYLAVERCPVAVPHQQHGLHGPMSHALAPVDLGGCIPMAEVPNPLAERESALAEMLAGHSGEATAEEARAALEAARQQRHENVIGEPRTLGFGVIKAGEPINGQRFHVAVTDGERNAAITITLTNTLILELGIKGEHTPTYVIERIDKFAAGIKPDNRYEDVLAAHPYTFVA